MVNYRTLKQMEMPWESSTYDFLIVNFQATDDKITRFLLLSILLSVGQIMLIMLVGRALQVKSVVDVDDFQHRHVLCLLFRCVNLFNEGRARMVAVD